MRSILFLAPIPPPFNGHSIMSKSILDILAENFKIIVVNLNKKSMIEGHISGFRILQIMKIYMKSFFMQWRSDFIYITISESIAGNLKDILIYILLFPKIHQTILHLHGGSIEKDVFLRSKLLLFVNKFFLSRVKNIIVLSSSHKSYFKSIIDDEKIMVIPNFISDDLIAQGEDFLHKFQSKGPIRLLFLSNMIPKKGYLILLESFLKISPQIRSEYELNFAGRFEDEESKKSFVKLVEDQENIFYHGEVFGERKARLLRDSHVFILPSLYNEGQPLALLEAYSFGCFVVATDCPGILDICKDKENGFILKREKIEEFTNILESLRLHKREFASIGKHNRKYVLDHFTKQSFRLNFLKSSIF
jgi:glycosyltransferase involved in cell wall biosynthesis